VTVFAFGMGRGRGANNRHLCRPGNVETPLVDLTRAHTAVLQPPPCAHQMRNVACHPLTHQDTQKLNSKTIKPPAQPSGTKVEGKPSTPAPTMAVTLWNAASCLYRGIWVSQHGKPVSDGF